MYFFLLQQEIHILTFQYYRCQNPVATIIMFRLLTNKHTSTNTQTMDAIFVIYLSPSSVPSAPPPNLRSTYTQGSIAQFTWDEIPCGSRGARNFHYTYAVLVDGVEHRSGRTSDTSFTVFDMPDGRVEFRVALTTDVGTGPYSEIDPFNNVALSGNYPLFFFSAFCSLE